MEKMEKVAIIGAGASGITAAKILHERGIPFDCFEMGSGIGGVWRYQNDTGLSAAYRSLHINTSKQRMNYSDFPFPDDFPAYPHHSQILQYFEHYVDHFGFREKISFNSCVQHVEVLSDGSYELTVNNEARRYSAVMVCNGHHWDTRWPEPAFEGNFAGKEMHSHDYREPEPFLGQNVVVLGIGNSGVDIAVDISRTAKNVYLATRSGAHITPKYLLGRPSDHWVSEASSYLPLWLQNALINLLRFITIGRQKAYGVPSPKRPMSAQHPTVSSDLLHYVGHGKIKIKANIARKDGDSIVFVDGSRVQADALIYCTGYKISFPFLTDSIINPKNNEVPLYQLTIHPDYKGLYFIGLIQPLGAIMPIAERQSLWVADLIEGKALLPDKATMQAEIQRRREKMAKRYDDRPRHTIQVDYWAYMRDIAREIKAGKKRVLNQKG
jgi:dimethylaniline monooxygenase (N-oxide forming)